jgi:hypothetical protein
MKARRLTPTQLRWLLLSRRVEVQAVRPSTASDGMTDKMKGLLRRSSGRLSEFVLRLSVVKF